MTASTKGGRRRMGRCLRRLTVLVVSVAASASHGEVILHGASTALPGPAVTVSGDVGSRQGRNLLHSFGVFNVLTGESVTYTLPTGAVTGDIGHVVSRVTGGTSAITGGKQSL